MNKFEGKLLENVYASYPVNSAAEKLLHQFSHRIITLIGRQYPMDMKPVVKIPSHYHVTADYKGDVDDISTYIQEIKEKQQRVSGRVGLGGVNFRRSNVNNNGIISVHPNGSIPFAYPAEAHPHITVAEITEAEPLFRTWFRVEQVLMSLASIRIELQKKSPDFNKAQVDVSRLEIWGKEKGNKALIIEV